MPRELQMPIGWGFVRQISAQPAVVYAQRFFQLFGPWEPFFRAERMERRSAKEVGKGHAIKFFHQILFET